MVYVQPTPATFKARFPEFTPVADARVQIFLSDAFIEIGSSWGDDQARAQEYWAAHQLSMAGEPGVSSGEGGSIALTGPIKRDKVGDVETEFVGNGTAGGSSGDNGNYGLTTYGQEYLRLLRLNFGGAIAVLSGPNGIYGQGCS